MSEIYDIESGLHAHVVPTDLIAPGTMRHVGEKLCQFAATNCTNGKQSTHIMSFKEAKPANMCSNKTYPARTHHNTPGCLR